MHIDSVSLRIGLCSYARRVFDPSALTNSTFRDGRYYYWKFLGISEMLGSGDCFKSWPLLRAESNLSSLWR